MAINELMSVDVSDRGEEWLKKSLRDAIQLEFSTIPPYLCAMWSIKSPSDHPFIEILRSVAVEEMLHFGIACNLLAGLGEWPNFLTPGFIPNYPCELPGKVHPGLIVGLTAFSQKLVTETFMEIEKPEHPLEIGLEEEISFPTIGMFYDAIKCAFQALESKTPGGLKLNDQWQIDEDGVGLQKYVTLDEVKSAIDQIKHQGEGTEQSPFEESTSDELAHFYRFQQIRDLKQIVKGADGKAKFGGPLTLPTDVYPMSLVPHGGHPPDISKPFDTEFTNMMTLLQVAWSNIESDARNNAMNDAITTMFKLKQLAVQLMSLPISGGTGNYGPSFRILPATT